MEWNTEITRRKFTINRVKIIVVMNDITCVLGIGDFCARIKSRTMFDFRDKLKRVLKAGTHKDASEKTIMTDTDYNKHIFILSVDNLMFSLCNTAYIVPLLKCDIADGWKFFDKMEKEFGNHFVV